MIVRKTTCPVCGNDTRVNNMKEEQKCEFCRRPIIVKFEMHKASGKNKWRVSAEAAPFERNQSFNRTDCKIKNLSKFREEDVYGKA